MFWGSGLKSRTEITKFGRASDASDDSGEPGGVLLSCSEPGQCSIPGLSQRGRLRGVPPSDVRVVGPLADAAAGLLPDAEPLPSRVAPPRRRRSLAMDAMAHDDPCAAILEALRSQRP